MNERFCLAVITARGGSKGVPSKNIRSFGGNPLIVHAIDCAHASKLVSDVMVTTDSEEIARISRVAGARVPFLRPAELATDTAKQEDAIRHLMDWVEANETPYEYILLLMPTSPLRRPETIISALELARESPGFEALYAVNPVELNLFFCNTLRPDGSMKDWVEPKYKWANRQELPEHYNLSGVFALSRWEAFKREHTFLHDGTKSFIVDPIESLDINTPLDFFLAEELWRRGIHSRGDLSKLEMTSP